jgi:hypothetical protein
LAPNGNGRGVADDPIAIVAAILPASCSVLSVRRNSVASVVGLTRS